MNHKDILKLRGLRDFLMDISNEHWRYYTDINDDPMLKGFHKGKSYAYEIAAERIEKLINDTEVDDNEKD